ncbi:hypothetical protein SESBI_06152 [Sesbania bispinosa]|nr:hypothetical protein SESBI_06152 [Sesbania bispinosa]
MTISAKQTKAVQLVLLKVVQTANRTHTSATCTGKYSLGRLKSMAKRPPPRVRPPTCAPPCAARPPTSRREDAVASFSCKAAAVAAVVLLSLRSHHRAPLVLPPPAVKTQSRFPRARPPPLLRSSSSLCAATTVSPSVRRYGAVIRGGYSSLKPPPNLPGRALPACGCHHGRLPLCCSFSPIPFLFPNLKP